MDIVMSAILLPVKGPDMVRGLSAGKQDYIVTSK